jgi:hypothetical protein
MNKAIIMAAFLLLVVPAVEGTTIVMNPGQSHVCETNETVSCGQCQQDTNETANVTECDTCGTCEIKGIELEPGEEYEFVEGVCDIDDIECLPCTEEGTAIRDREYTMDVFVNKLDGCNLGIRIETMDPFGTIVDSAEYSPLESEDVMSNRHRYNFTCPSKILVDNVDQQSCFQYLDDHVLKNKNLELNNSMNVMKSEFEKEYENHVPIYYAWSTWALLAFIVVLVVVFAASGKGGFGK